MKIFKYTLFILNLSLIPLGFYLATTNSDQAFGTFLIGNFFLIIYFLARIIKQLIRKQKDNNRLIVSFLIIITIILLYLKYANVEYVDIPSMIIIPIFMLTGMISIIFQGLKDKIQSITLLLLIIMCIPLFTKPFYRSPRPFIPQKWHHRYTALNDIKTTPNQFSYPETKALVEFAKKQRAIRNNNGAIESLEKALFLEPTNSYLYFELGQTFANKNDIETGIAYLDSSLLYSVQKEIITLNQRGLMHMAVKNYNSALQDFNQVLEIDSTLGYIYVNKALAYANKKEYKLSTLEIKKAELHHYDVHKDKRLNYLLKHYYITDSIQLSKNIH